MIPFYLERTGPVPIGESFRPRQTVPVPVRRRNWNLTYRKVVEEIRNATVLSQRLRLCFLPRSSCQHLGRSQDKGERRQPRRATSRRSNRRGGKERRKGWGYTRISHRDPRTWPDFWHARPSKEVPTSILLGSLWHRTQRSWSLPRGIQCILYTIHRQTRRSWCGFFLSHFSVTSWRFPCRFYPVPVSLPFSVTHSEVPSCRIDHHYLRRLFVPENRGSLWPFFWLSSIPSISFARGEVKSQRGKSRWILFWLMLKTALSRKRRFQYLERLREIDWNSFFQFCSMRIVCEYWSADYTQRTWHKGSFSNDLTARFRRIVPPGKPHTFLSLFAQTTRLQGRASFLIPWEDPSPELPREISTDQK